MQAQPHGFHGRWEAEDLFFFDLSLFSLDFSFLILGSEVHGSICKEVAAWEWIPVAGEGNG